MISCCVLMSVLLSVLARHIDFHTIIRCANGCSRQIDGRRAKRFSFASDRPCHQRPVIVDFPLACGSRNFRCRKWAVPARDAAPRLRPCHGTSPPRSLRSCYPSGHVLGDDVRPVDFPCQNLGLCTHGHHEQLDAVQRDDQSETPASIKVRRGFGGSKGGRSPTGETPNSRFARNGRV